MVVPDVVEYSVKTQLKVAEEIPTCPASAEFLKDYYVMRNQARAIKGEKVNLLK